MKILWNGNDGGAILSVVFEIPGCGPLITKAVCVIERVDSECFYASCAHCFYYFEKISTIILERKKTQN